METYHWILTALVAVCAVWIAQRTGLIDRKTAVLGSIGAIATSILGRNLSKGDDTADNPQAPREQDVDDIPVDDKIDSPEDIENDIEKNNPSGDVFDNASDDLSDS